MTIHWKGVLSKGIRIVCALSLLFGISDRLGSYDNNLSHLGIVPTEDSILNLVDF